MKRTLRLFGCCLAVLFAALPVAAQEQPRERAFVYGINASVPDGYNGSFAPPSAQSIYLLADTVSILSPRMTQIYFWPITNEYKASWELLNEPVTGTLEVWQGSQMLAQLASSDYTIQYTPQGSRSAARLFLDQEARTAQEAFAAKQRAYQQASGAYYTAQRAWEAAVDEANARIRAGQQATLPPEPQPPEPIGVLSNGINQGFALKLAAGSYTLQLRLPDGTILPASRRQLTVFNARQTAVGYTLVPQQRWTTPEQVNDPGDVILAAAGSTLYLAPQVIREFPAREFALLLDPQQPLAANSDWRWVPGEPLNVGTLEQISASQVAATPLTSYLVRQVQGSALGYEVQPYPADASRPPDIVGFPLVISGAQPDLAVRLRANDGTLLPGSERLVRVPRKPPLAALLLLALVPLALAAPLILRRRLRMRLPRNLAG